jgi:hypothetical protein
MPLLCCVLISSAAAQTSDTFTPHILPTLDAQRAAGTIDIDGALDDAGWLNAARADGFTETYPGDGVQPTVTTEVRIAYDDYNLYVAFICQDEPKEIRAYLHDRNSVKSEDQVGMFIDTYDDADYTVAMFANPLGVQTANYQDDLLYSSAGRITETGYQVELAIPFSSLRFPNMPTQSWRINFQRIRPRESRTVYEWAATSRDNSCFPCQFGTLTGLRDLQFDHRLELLPTVTADYSIEQRGSRSRFASEASLTTRYVPASNISISALIRPEIGSINSQASTLFSSLSLSRPEASLLHNDVNSHSPMPMYTLLTRTDVVATAVAGRFGRTSITYQGQYAEQGFSQSLAAEDDPSVVNEAGIRQSLGNDAFIGASAGSRHWFDKGDIGYIETVGRLRMQTNYLFSWELGASTMTEPVDTLDNINRGSFDNGRYSARFDGEHFTGHNIRTSFQRNAEHWNYALSYTNATSRFRTPAMTSFILGGQSVQGSTSYNFYPSSSVVERITPSTAIGHNLSSGDGAPNSTGISASVTMLMKHMTSLQLHYTSTLSRNEPTHNLGLFMSREFTQAVRSTAIVSYFTNHSFNGIFTSIEIGVLPLRSLEIDGHVDFQQSYSSGAGSLYPMNFRGGISATYYIQPELSAYTIFMIRGTTERTNSVEIEPRILYRPNTYSTFSLGYGRTFRQFNSDASSFISDQQQIVLKAQYFFGL